MFIVNELNLTVVELTNTRSYMVTNDTGYGGAISINSGHALESVLSHELAKFSS